jgi:hypothetical protein
MKPKLSRHESFSLQRAWLIGCQISKVWLSFTDAVFFIAHTAMVGSCAINQLRFTAVKIGGLDWPWTLPAGAEIWLSAATDPQICLMLNANNWWG